MTNSARKEGWRVASAETRAHNNQLAAVGPSSPPMLGDRLPPCRDMAERRQVVVWMRHGVARHNVADPATGRPPDPRDPSLVDPPLAAGGREQCVEAGAKVRQWWRRQNLPPVQMIVTSPLTRCLQTVFTAFLPGDDCCWRQPPISVVCREDVREVFGVHHPDRRQDGSQLRGNWPRVEFEAAMAERDGAWRPDERETWDDLCARVRRFLTWLVQRPEQRVVVVSHGVWLEALFREAGVPDFSPAGNGRGGPPRRVYNAEAFACHCVSRNGAFVGLQSFTQIQTC